MGTTGGCEVHVRFAARQCRMAARNCGRAFLNSRQPSSGFFAPRTPYRAAVFLLAVAKPSINTLKWTVRSFVGMCHEVCDSGYGSRSDALLLSSKHVVLYRCDGSILAPNDVASAFEERPPQMFSTQKLASKCAARSSHVPLCAWKKLRFTPSANSAR